MLKQGTFINRKYYKLFAGSFLGALAPAINIMLDSVISGNQLGETALTAVSIVAPLSYIMYFFTNLFASGYGILYGKYNGEFNAEKSYRIAGQALVTSAMCSVFLAGMLLVLKGAFLRYYDCSGELLQLTSEYYNWIILLAALLPFASTFYFLLAADADTVLLSISTIVNIIINVVLSTVLCKKYGIAGLGIGTCVGTFCAILLGPLHLLRETNSIRFRLCFHFREFLASVKLSSTVCCSYFFIGLTDIIMNKVILITSGTFMVAAYSVINLVYSFFDSFDAPVNAAKGFSSTFLGEKNNAGIQNVMKTALRSTAGLALVYAALLLIFAPLLPRFYGMETPAVVEASVKAARWMALAAVPYGISFVMESSYPSFDRVRQGLLLTFLNDFFCPLAISIPLAYLCGFTGVSIGMGVNAFFVLALFTILVVAKNGKRGFPLYLKDTGEETVSFDSRVDKESIVPLRDAVLAELTKRGYEIDNVGLLIEELYTRILEKNPGKKILSECVLLFGAKHVRIIIRDNGTVFNFVDENNRIESLNAHVLNSLLEQTKEKNYVLTTSFNRNGFIFEKDSAEKTALPC